jgi:hypothetical protein
MVENILVHISKLLTYNAVLIVPVAALGRTANELHMHLGTKMIARLHSYSAVLMFPDGALGRTTKEGVAGSRFLILYIASFLACSTSVISCWKTPFSSLFKELFSVRELKLVSELAS